MDAAFFVDLLSLLIGVMVVSGIPGRWNAKRVSPVLARAAVTRRSR